MKRAILDTYSGPWTPGIDLSAYQPSVDWRTVARSEVYADAKRLGPPRFCIVRSGDGVQTRLSSAADPWAVRHLSGAADAGLLVDVYHYVRAFHSAEAQVAVILDVLRVSGAPVRTVWLDVEGRDDDPRTKADEGRGAWWAPANAFVGDRPTTLDVLRCLEDMRLELGRAGLRAGIYTGVAWHERMALRRVDVSTWASAPLWTPYYTHSGIYRMPAAPPAPGQPWPWTHATIWQCAGSQAIPGRVAGVQGICDVNLFRGDEAALRAWWDAPAPRRC